MLQPMPHAHTWKRILALKLRIRYLKDLCNMGVQIFTSTISHWISFHGGGAAIHVNCSFKKCIFLHAEIELTKYVSYCFCDFPKEPSLLPWFFINVLSLTYRKYSGIDSTLSTSHLTMCLYCTLFTSSSIYLTAVAEMLYTDYDSSVIR